MEPTGNFFRDELWIYLILWDYYIAYCHTPVLKDVNQSFYTWVQDVQIKRTANSKVNNSQRYDYNITRVYLLQNDPWGWKRLQSKQHHIIYSKRGLNGLHRRWPGESMPTLPLLAWTGHHGSILLLHLWQWKTNLSRLMVATQQVCENNDMGTLDNGKLTVVLHL
jgi:hypothetical protein